MNAAQIAQQKTQTPAAQQPAKAGSSKFDNVMANKADSAQGANAAQAAQKTQATQQTQKTDGTQKVAEVSKTEKSTLNKIRPDATSTKAAPSVDQKAQSSMVNNMTKMMSDLEKGQGVMDKLINSGLSGKNISNGELLSLQAGMYKYTQELELTGKVVEKATTGLKDTLKTQV